MATPTWGEESIEVAAPTDQLYDLVADLTRMGEWSPECYRVEWVGGATSPRPGAEFLGHNRLGFYRWSVSGKVVNADRGREFAFTTYADGRESTRWRYTFEPLQAGTRLSERYELIWTTPLVRLGNLAMPRRRMLRQGMRRTLQRIKASAERSSVAPD